MKTSELKASIDGFYKAFRDFKAKYAIDAFDTEGLYGVLDKFEEGNKISEDEIELLESWAATVRLATSGFNTISQVYAGIGKKLDQAARDIRNAQETG